MFDAELYRDKAEVEEWKKRDPIATLAMRLRAEDWLTDDGFAQIESEVAGEIAAAVAFAEAGTWEPVDHLMNDVYTQSP
jgi:pyruvate dehydrogenase E1 component alpha subunit